MTSSDAPSQSSSLTQFLTSIPSLTSDLTQITAPPFLQSPVSATQLPSSWCERPSLLLAPATVKNDEKERARLVLKWYLASLKNLIYMGRREDEGAKKPLNAVLGEVCIGHWGDESSEEGVTRLVSEQVSHHPPVTGCYILNEKRGVSAEGYTSQRVTLARPNKLSPSFNISVQQIGHAILRLHDIPSPSGGEPETYVVTLPTIILKDLLSPSPSYPELSGHAFIVSSSGYTARIDFSGVSTLSSIFSSSAKKESQKNTLHAVLYPTAQGPEKAFVEAEGQWNGQLQFFEVDENGKRGKQTDEWDARNPSVPVSEMKTENVGDMDSWEAQKLWKGVVDAVKADDMGGVGSEKTKVEEAQRGMRKREKEDGKPEWEQIMFDRVSSSHNGKSDVAEKLLTEAGIVANGEESHKDGVDVLGRDKTDGVWRIKSEDVVKEVLARRGKEGLRKGVSPLGYE